jgi:hypothetical protein
MFETIAENSLNESIEAFENYKKLAEKSFVQISDEEFFKAIDEEANSIATVAKHIGGNLRSRWSDFLTSDGEKPDRDRDAEFVAENSSRDDVMQIWETGWQTLFDTLKSLATEDLARTVKIRTEDFTVTKAISRSLAHTAYHVGQIVLLAKHFRSGEWQTLSIPRNNSAEFNRFLAAKKDKGNYLEAAGEFAEKER